MTAPFDYPEGILLALATLLEEDPSGASADNALRLLEEKKTYTRRQADELFSLAEELAYSTGKEEAIWHLLEIKPLDYWAQKGYHLRRQKRHWPLIQAQR